MVLVFVIGICMTLYYLLDHVWNGAFVNWFSENYMQLHPVDRADGTEVYIWQPYWPSVKILLLWLLIFNVLFWLAVVYGVSHYYSRKQLRSAVTEISDMMRSYMNEDVAAARVFPKEYAEISSQMAELKSNMQRHEQILKEEATRKNDSITYLAHDLKTPLTSILNYSDLLGKMDLTPEEANDYARIIYQKGLRLKNLTSDLFDISKVQSGAEQIISERLDACTLARQALAEQDKAVQESGLTVKAAIPERELPIWADGRKLSRVLENLIGNCVKYALKGTRVFLSVAEENGRAIIELKNTANYEMDFAADEITERFVRGDAARSTEGSGLGLAIAKSYTEACGGTFDVSVDGDQFKVRIGFPVYGMTAK